MSATPAPASARALDVDLFERLTARKLDVHTDKARARALGISRVTIYRLRARRHAPSLDLADRVSRQLGTTIDRLFPVEVAR